MNDTMIEAMSRLSATREGIADDRKRTEVGNDRDKGTEQEKKNVSRSRHRWRLCTY